MEFDFDTGFFDYVEQNTYGGKEEEHPTDALNRELEEEEDYDVE